MVVMTQNHMTNFSGFSGGVKEGDAAGVTG